MANILPELIIGPLLVGAATLAARRWGTAIGGLLSAFPAVVGPVLLITAQERGDLFAARAASGTLLGLGALSAFVLIYARVAVRARWGWSLAAGWSAAALIALALGWLDPAGRLAAGLLVATGSLLIAYVAMPRGAGPAPPAVQPAGETRPEDDLRLRMILTAVLVASLASAAMLVGPLVGGILAGLPVLASVLAVFTHRRGGHGAVVGLLRGMVVGMSGFVAFCAVVAASIVALGAGPAFAAAIATAVALQLLLLERAPRRAVSLTRP